MKLKEKQLCYYCDKPVDLNEYGWGTHLLLGEYVVYHMECKEVSGEEE